MKRLQKCALIVCLMVVLSGCQSENSKMVQQKITAIGTVSEASEAGIKAARNAYDALSDSDKKAISNYTELETAEHDLDQLYANKVDALIEEIGVIDDESGAKISAARDAYELLSKNQKSLIMNFGVLVTAEKDYDSYIVGRATTLLGSLSTVSATDENEIELAEKIYNELTEEQKKLVTSKMPDAAKAIKDARIQLTIAKIELLKPSKNEPTEDELRNMIDATTTYLNLDTSSRDLVTNYKTLKLAKKNFESYLLNRVKTDKLFARTEYINQCEMVSYDDLMAYPTSYKNCGIAIDVQLKEFEDGVLMFPGSIVAVAKGTEKAMQLKDGRTIKEPALNKDDEITVYGTYTGTTTVKVPENGSGLFGSNLFGKTAEKYDIPVLDFKYTSKDNLGLIATGNPNATEYLPDENIEIMKEQLSELFEELK